MSAFAKMWAIVAALFVTMKVLVLLASRVRLTPARTLAFFFWPGMYPSTFALPLRQLDGVCERLMRGARNVALGATLFVAARYLPLAAGLPVVLLALSLMLHFGIFPIATATWRRAGFDVDDVFRQPWRSKSLAEFWSRRWNVGFSEMLTILVSRPVGKRLGRTAGMVAAFLASGLLHELAISVPAGGGYGLPTLYFALQGALVRAGVRGRLATLLAVALPVPLCFHAPFVRAIVIPLLHR